MPDIIKKFTIHEKEYTLELSCPFGAADSYHVMIDNYYQGEYIRKTANGRHWINLNQVHGIRLFLRSG